MGASARNEIDTLTGGRGADRFVVAGGYLGDGASGYAAISDFSLAQRDQLILARGLRYTFRQTATGTEVLAGGDITLDVPLHEGVNHVRIVVRGKVGTREEMLLLRHAGRGELDRRGRLFVVAIGVSRYPKLDGLDLTYTVADAREFLATIKDKLGPDHDGGVIERLLVSGAGGVDEPTRDNVIDALSLFRQAGERDTVVLFVAGHGWNHPGTRNYVFLPSDAEFEGEQLRPSRLVPWTDIESAISTKGLRLLFVDTCRSQSSYNERLLNDGSARDIVVYSASGSEHEALEDASIKHGYFTYALVEGLKGKAALEDGAIYATTLYDYVFHDVRKRSNFVQEPQFYKSAQTRNLVLARRHAR